MNTLNQQYMNMKTITHLFLLCLPLAFLTACGPKKDTASTAIGSDNPAPANALLLAAAPADYVSLNEGMAAANTGETLVVYGRIGGTLKPLTEGFAGFVLADESLQFCDEMGKDGHCTTPWDACCEDPDKIAASRAFVQFNDASGDPLQLNLRQLGVAENAQVVVKGTLSPESTPGNPIILAEAMAILPKSQG